MNLQGQKPNRLIDESSPYLLQHAYNPVDWHPWNEDALARAQAEDKMLIISIGYAACHWCHVMEHESFEDSTVAEIMNQNFIAIKVDREERPDIDDIYMSAAQLVSGSGGWPLNAFALPDGRPVWAGTYFPKDKWIDILQQFTKMYKDDRQRLLQSAEKLTSGINSMGELDIVPMESEFDTALIAPVADKLSNQIDMEFGGRRGAPKFPMPNNWEFLLKHWHLSQEEASKQAVTTTLDQMAFGGIYDQLGGGFARYSVDAMWLVPHFEKMLYDNAQLVSSYSKAYQKTENPLYLHIVNHTLSFIERELTHRDGGFYSSLDADSEGEEGKYYVWSAEEIDAILDQNSLPLFRDYYNIKEKGNWEHDKNILHVTRSLKELAEKYNYTEEEAQNIIDQSCQTLFKIRNNRVRPRLDDKILCSWNALMTEAYVDAFRATGNEKFRQIAIDQCEFLLNSMMEKDYRLWRNYKNGKATINAFLDDYAHLISALIATYEITFDKKWLDHAIRLTQYVDEHFTNPDNKMYYYTSDIDEPLASRKVVTTDNVIPSSNSVMARNLLTLGELYYNKDYIDRARQMMTNMMPVIAQARQPSFYSNWLQLLQNLSYTPYEIAIVGENAHTLRDELSRHYLGQSVILGSSKEENLPLLKYKYQPQKTLIYVCQNKTCKLPVETVEGALQIINN